jgi:hypothetical protein
MNDRLRASKPAPVPRLKAASFFAALSLSLAGCSTYFTDGTKLPCTITHRAENGQLIIRAEVTNASDKVLTFVNHPDFYYLLVTATDRNRARAEGGALISYVRATAEDLEKVPPGEKFVAEKSYNYRRLSPRTVEISDKGYFGFKKRIWDPYLRAEFSYGSTLEYLPAHAWILGRNYVVHSDVFDIDSRDSYRTDVIKAASVFRAP